MLLQFIINGLITGLLYSLLAIGFALVYNTTKVFHLAAAGLYVAAAYMFWWLSGYLPLCLAGGMAMLFSAALSLLIDLSVYRPLQKRNSSLNSILVASIGVMTILVNMIAILWGNESKLFSTDATTLEFGRIFLNRAQLYQFAIGLGALIIFIIFTKKTSLGLRLQALTFDRELFGALGYNEWLTRSYVILLSGCFIGLSSILNVYDVGMDPNMGMNLLINAMVAMIIGGIGRIEMCIAGGVLLGVLQSLVICFFSSAWQMAITFIVLLLLLFFRPQGLMGYKRRMV